MKIDSQVASDIIQEVTDFGNPDLGREIDTESSPGNRFRRPDINQPNKYSVVQTFRRSDVQTSPGARSPARSAGRQPCTFSVNRALQKIRVENWND